MKICRVAININDIDNILNLVKRSFTPKNAKPYIQYSKILQVDWGHTIVYFGGYLFGLLYSPQTIA